MPQSKARKREWDLENRDRTNAARRAIPLDQRDGKRAAARQWYANHTPEQRAYWQTYMRVHGLKRRFGLSLVKWLSIFNLQGECCACCHSPNPGGKRWHTDHDHVTGVVRGILCNACNTTLGRLGDRLQAVEDSTRRFTSYLRCAEPRYARGGDKPADANDRLVPWEPKRKAAA